jgi:hypothetical protein
MQGVPPYVHKQANIHSHNQVLYLCELFLLNYFWTRLGLNIFKQSFKKFKFLVLFKLG